MKKGTLILLAMVFCTVGLAGNSFAIPSDLIMDSYLHPLDSNDYQTTEDVIGNPANFDFHGYRWVGSTLEIYTNWSLGLGSSQYGAYLGDIFLYDENNYNPQTTDGIIAVLAVRNHDLSGEDDGIKAGDLFVPEKYRYSDLYFSGYSTSSYGDNEFVTASGGLIERGITLENIIDSSGTNVIYADLSIFDDQVDFSTSQIRFAPTCGNDILAAATDTAPVPEPATMLLFGTGLAGLAGYGRKKAKK